MKIAFFNSKTGTTLIEVMIALMIIGIIIIGGGMFFFHGRVNIVREAHRRAAVLVASQRLEELKAANWDDITPAEFPATYDSDKKVYVPPSYIVWRDDKWECLEERSSDYVMVDNLIDQEMLTRVWYCDDDGVGDSYDYLKVTTTVEWSDSTTNSVSSTTLIAPR